MYAILEKSSYPKFSNPKGKENNAKWHHAKYNHHEDEAKRHGDLHEHHLEKRDIATTKKDQEHHRKLANHHEMMYSDHKVAAKNHFNHHQKITANAQPHHTMSATPSKEEYSTHRDKHVIVGGHKGTVFHHNKINNSGSWSGGFVHNRRTFGGVKRHSDGHVTLNHGKTWHPDVREAEKSKGKVQVSHYRDDHDKKMVERIDRRMGYR